MKLGHLIKDSQFKSLEQLPNWLKIKEAFSKQIRSIRTILGMTQAQLAKRASQNSRIIRRLESGEVDPRLSTLTKTAKGLECELIIRLVPRKSILTLLRERARKKAEMIVNLSKGNAAMEEQEPDKKYIKQQIEEIGNNLIDRRNSQLWED